MEKAKTEIKIALGFLCLQAVICAIVTAISAAINTFGSSGFFFEDWDLDDNDRQIIQDFIDKARKYLKKDWRVIYYGWY